MAERINLNRFKKNLPPIKDVAKTTAAMTLLLSTAACSSNSFGGDGVLECLIIPIIGYGILWLAVGIGTGWGGGRGGEQGSVFKKGDGYVMMGGSLTFDEDVYNASHPDNPKHIKGDDPYDGPGRY